MVSSQRPALNEGKQEMQNPQSLNGFATLVSVIISGRCDIEVVHL
jgi:hypothetical protein